MSDDTPAQRFDATPGEPAAGSGAAPATAPTAPEQKKTSRGVLIALIVLGAVLLIAVIVLLALLLHGTGQTTAAVTPTSGSTPSSTPSASASATPSAIPSASTPPKSGTGTTSAPKPPAATGPTVTVFSSSTAVGCDSRTNNPIPLKFAWSGSGDAAYFAVGATNDPKANGQGWTLPTTGNQADFPDGNEILYPCFQQNAIYTIGIYDTNGNKAVKQLIVKNIGEVK
jgi:hypothetical protein